MVQIKFLVACNLLFVCSLTSAIEEIFRQKLTKLTRSNERRFLNYPSRNSSLDGEESRTNRLTADVQKTQSFSPRSGHIKMKPSTLGSGLQRGKSVLQWEDYLFLSSSGNGQEKKGKKTEDDDDKKTLAQQVKEGKYGLLQNEIFREKPKKMGVLSYLSNPEIPKDSVQNFGGLDREEIWLAENHLLVLKGGGFSEKYLDDKRSSRDFQEWSPIDDYEAPRRQVKIPSMPKIPPPFPVQLTDNEPIKILESNNMTSNKNKSDWLSTWVESNNTIYKEIAGDTRDEKKIKSGQALGGVVGPFFSSLPLGTHFVPSSNNETDYDEDDQSIYYPPAYTFTYYQDNSTVVPPGPLVPGIILPPPPNFFSKLEEKKLTATKEQALKYNKRPISSKSTDTQHYSPRKLASKPYKITYSSTVASIQEQFAVKSINNFNNNEIKTIVKSPKRVSPVVTPITYNHEELKIYPTKSTLKNQALEPSILEKENCWTNTRPSSKTDPFSTYYPTSTPSTANGAIEAAPLSIKNIIESDEHSKVFPVISSYYFYEKNNDNEASKKTTQSPHYKIKDFSQETPSKKPYENFQLTSSHQTSKYKASLDSELFLKTHEQAVISETQPLYYQPIANRQEQLNLRNLLATPITKEKQISDKRAKSNPVYQYSFEAADYSEHERKIESHPQNDVVFNEWREVQDKVNRQNSDDTEIALNQRIKPDQNHYRSRLPIVISSTTPKPLGDTTTSDPKPAYYTKQDETYLDDVTKEYFTNFGKKIKQERLSSTTPIYGKTSSVTVRPGNSRFLTFNSFTNDNYDNRQTYKSPRVNVHYGDQPRSHYLLKDNTRISNKFPFSPINSDAEYQPGYDLEKSELVLQKYHDQRKLHKNSNVLNKNSSNRKTHQPNDSYNSQQVTPTSVLSEITPFDESRDFLSKPIIFSSDIVNKYRHSQSQIDSQSNYFDLTNAKSANQDNRSLYFAYQLPGDGGHFYFLTPHAITQKFSHKK
ncbi:uncharacterized protein LOC122859544 [Aphidius gifuensis]|uniref:uncharacterized protein LOC122859544 n=1 Tax=Aphidius gifuensis TaxID=684658 RepID=UPI001CDB7394|nr:uncharacterized protein LOC122859544 [Aphidius gifuensis]